MHVSTPGGLPSLTAPKSRTCMLRLDLWSLTIPLVRHRASSSVNVFGKPGLQRSMCMLNCMYTALNNQGFSFLINCMHERIWSHFALHVGPARMQGLCPACISCWETQNPLNFLNCISSIDLQHPILPWKIPSLIAPMRADLALFGTVDQLQLGCRSLCCLVHDAYVGAGGLPGHFLRAARRARYSASGWIQLQVGKYIIPPAHTVYTVRTRSFFVGNWSKLHSGILVLCRNKTLNAEIEHIWPRKWRISAN